MLHQLKCDPEPFDALQSGKKTCELRLNDRNYQVGDELHLWRTYRSAAEMAAGEPLAYTGAVLTVKVAHTLYGPSYGLPAGYALLSLHPVYMERLPMNLAILGPIRMVLHCPKCGAQHVDAPKVCDAEHCRDGCACPGDCLSWTNPPHKSHLCHECGTIWRPCDIPTAGVASIETKGKDDTWKPD